MAERNLDERFVRFRCKRLKVGIRYLATSTFLRVGTNMLRQKNMTSLLLATSVALLGSAAVAQVNPTAAANLKPAQEGNIGAKTRARGPLPSVSIIADMKPMGNGSLFLQNFGIISQKKPKYITLSGAFNYVIDPKIVPDFKHFLDEHNSSEALYLRDIGKPPNYLVRKVVAPSNGRLQPDLDSDGQGHDSDGLDQGLFHHASSNCDSAAIARLPSNLDDAANGFNLICHAMIKLFV